MPIVTTGSVPSLVPGKIPVQKTLFRLLSLVLVLSTPIFGQSLSLQQAINYALDHSPDLNVARTQADIAELQRKITFTQFMPSLDIGAIHGLSHTVPIVSTTDPWSSSIALTAKETLYDNGITLLQYGQSKINRDFALLTTTRTRDQLCLDVITAFYNLSLAQQTRDINAEQLKNLEKQFMAVSDMYKQGFKTRADFLRLKTQVQRGRLDLVSADTALANSVIELRRVLGSDKSDADSLAFSAVEPNQVSVETPEATVLPETTYDYRLAEIQAKSTKVNIDIAQRNYYPQVNLSAGGTYGYANYLGGPGPAGGETGWNLLLSVNYNIFDWGLRRHQVEVAQAQQMVQENQVTKARITVKAALDTIMQNFRQLKADYILSKELLQLEQENYTLIRANYQEGKVQYLDLINSLSDLFSAKQAFVNAVFGLAQNLAKYRFYEGTLYAQTY